MVIPWSFHGHAMVISWLLPWSFHGHFMVIAMSWSFNDDEEVVDDDDDDPISPNLFITRRVV
eukprot:10753736-Lingulodinium_polyedra.AAC.1